MISFCRLLCLWVAKMLALLFIVSQIYCENILDEYQLQKIHERIPSIEAPAFLEPSEPIYETASDIISAVTPILKNRLKVCLYDRVNIWHQFLQHIEKADQYEIGALNSFHPNFDISRQKGSACVGMTLDLIEKIPAHFHPYIVAAKLPAKFEQELFPYYCHTAVIIRFKNPLSKEEGGYILLDPAFDIPVPILLDSNHSQQLIDMREKGKWLFKIGLKGAQDVIVCYTNLNDLDNPATHMIYRTDQFANPIPASAIPMFLADKKPTLLSRNEEGIHYAHLNLELNKKAILVSVNYRRQEPISFHDLVSKKYEFDPQLTSLFGMSPTELRCYFEFLISNIDTILKIQMQYRKIVDLIIEK